MSSDSSVSPSVSCRVFGLILALVGLVMAVPGVYLIVLGGSWYYTLAGIGLLIAGLGYVRGAVWGFVAFALVFVATCIWAVWEAGFNVWPLVPRLVAPMVLAIPAVQFAPGLAQGNGHRLANVTTAALLAGVAAMFWGMFTPQAVIRNDWDRVEGLTPAPDSIEAGYNWAHYGRTPRGTRYAPFDQITASNVDKLEVAWTYQHGDPPSGTGQDQNTPLYVDGLVYQCSPNNIVSALEGTTGTLVWRFDPQARSPVWQRCRGVTYYVPTPPAGEGAPQRDECETRIVLTTVDARLIQIDARTGDPCKDFGVDGAVDLKRNMGEVPDGFYFPTSAPTVMDDRIIIGGWVWDGMAVDEPSGVVRAFDGRTGDLLWAWDLGNPETSALPPQADTYTRNTPNVWSTPSFDAALGLVYLPTGNAQPDFYGSARPDAAHGFSSSIVALDVETGKPRWSFQTVYRDVWDYDVPSQPILFDLPDGAGGDIPALIQLTKRGQTFVLDRRDGTPLHDIEERDVPIFGPEAEFLSPTQPYPVGGIPGIGTDPLTEASMWGATPLDQLYCRIAFRRSAYEGDFTPMSTQGTLIWPGYFGGMNWGSATVDEVRGLMVVNDARIVHRVTLVPRDEVEGSAGAHDGLAPQLGAPFAAYRANFLSPLGVPCQQPPFGTLTAVDLTTNAVVWQVPIGTVEETGPLGLRTGLRMPVGMPAVGGPVSTAGGLVFYAGTQDYYLRAFETETGREVWRAPLPVGSQATPMSYVGQDGRQYIVVAVGGLNDVQGRGDFVIAFALPGE
ncbi:MAG: membrane-bound PQQ-dependent dehydrogenase, glucose/quinate/shikimate family [Pseudomonadota bacterium]